MQGTKRLGRGRVLAIFSIRDRGTAVVVEMGDGVWSSGSLLVCPKGHYHIRSVEFVDGKDLPRTAVALLIDESEVSQHVAVGEEVWSESQTN
jgi:hypothetical protein